MSRSMSHVYDPPAPHHPGDEDSPAAVQHAPLHVFTCEGLREVDRLASHRYAIPSIVLMENASRGLADEAMKMLRRTGEPNPHVLIFCGRGNNGGDGYAAARHLNNRGIDVTLVSLGDPQPETDAGINAEICARMGLRRIDASDLNRFAKHNQITLIIDAIFGTGLDRPIEPGAIANAIDWINHHPARVLAADIPSGLNGDTGEIMGIAVRATRTVTFVGLKQGFIGLDAQKTLGEVVVKDIGVPRDLIEEFGTSLDEPHPPEPPEHEPLEPGRLPRHED